jgi:DNA-binding NtrC family response regulator
MSEALRPVVIVEDEIDHAIIIRHVLADVAPGVSVEVMTDPLRLEERLLGVPQGALLLMDRRLGPLESVDLLPLLSASRPDLRIAILSAALPGEERERALRFGAFEAVEKPGSLDGWRGLLRRLLDLEEGREGAVA